MHRLSYRRPRKFLGLGTADSGGGTIDHSTIALFHKRLHDEGLAGELFDAVKAPLRDQGLIVSEGTAVDATILETPRGRPRKHDGLETSKDKAADVHHKSTGVSTTATKRTSPAMATRSSPTTSWTRPPGKRCTTAITSIGRSRPKLPGAAVWADSAYRSEGHQERVEGNGAFFGVVHRRVRYGQIWWMGV